MTRHDWAILLPILGACCVAVGLTSCVAKFGDGAVHFHLMNPNTQIGVSRSNQAGGEENEVWPETEGGANIDAEAAIPGIP